MRVTQLRLHDGSHLSKNSVVAVIYDTVDKDIHQVYDRGKERGNKKDTHACFFYVLGSVCCSDVD